MSDAWTRINYDDQIQHTVGFEFCSSSVPKWNSSAKLFPQMKFFHSIWRAEVPSTFCSSLGDLAEDLCSSNESIICSNMLSGLPESSCGCGSMESMLVAWVLGSAILCFFLSSGPKMLSSKTVTADWGKQLVSTCFPCGAGFCCGTMHGLALS